MNDTTTAPDTRPARYEQEVELTIRFAVTGEAHRFDTTRRDLIQRAVEEAVKRFMPPVLLDATIDISAKSLPGSGRYVYPEQAAETPVRKGDIVIALDEVPFA